MRYLFSFVILLSIASLPGFAQEISLNSSVHLGEAFPEIEYSHQLATFKEARHPLHLSAFAGYWRESDHQSRCEAVCAIINQSFLRSGIRLRYSVSHSPIRVAFGGGVRHVVNFVRVGGEDGGSRWTDNNTSGELLVRVDIPVVSNVLIHSSLIRWFDKVGQTPDGPYIDLRLGAVYSFDH